MTYKDTYTDVYAFHAKYGSIPPQDRDEAYWKGLLDEMMKKGRNDEFTMALLEAVGAELERVTLAQKGRSPHE